MPEPTNPALRARTRRAPALSAGAAGHDDAALAALEAFDLGAALIDLTLGHVSWCSPGFTLHCLVQVGDRIERLEPRLPGLRDALGRLERPPAMRSSSNAPRTAPRASWSAASGLGQTVLAEACLARPGLAALRLRETDAELAGAAHEQALRRHLEDRERLLFTSRSLAVGEMASTLAHELNQPIGTVTNVLRGLRLRLEHSDVGSEMTAGVQLALDQALFAARVIARIREYTHSRQPRREALDLGAVAREALSLLDWEFRRDAVQLQWTDADRPLRVLGDEVMLQQVVVNLLRNALDAMRGNHAGAAAGIQRRLHLRLAVERQMAVLSVRDNGSGLPSGSEGLLFVPFQSSKPNGMGIGLNICRSFVELHQGRLWFSPNEGGERGCTFHIALPLMPADSHHDPRSDAP